MASSSSKPKKTYHVFLSFRGPDVRNNFLSHLYTALDQTGIYTYIDSEELRKGEHISSALMKAIEESRIAIVIFSKDYAFSSWCLEELAKIMECKTQKDLIVLPVFYKVEPKEVREGRESYLRAMDKHKSRKDSDTVKRWKKALFDAGNLSGWDLKDGDEANHIKGIVKEISKQLERTPLHVAKHPVGLHPRVAKLESMLNFESHDNVLMVGLWGQGGIGKTTLAKALYNSIFRQFESSCFLANVKDYKDLVPLQKQLLLQMLRIELTVFSVDGGISLIQERLSCKKVLLVLDDIDDIKQLNALAGDCEWFDKGSLIIITTRNSHLLTSHGIDKNLIYEVKILEHGEALELFHKHAFRGNNKVVIRRDLVERALHYASGLPLALEVLGSFLHGRSEVEWKSALNRLAKSPDQAINDVLKLSYDGLGKYDKEIFLDIACFFKGRPTEYITKVLDSCDLDTIIGVKVLIEKSLIIEDTSIIQMHDLIQSMGMNIVRDPCCDDPGRRSRIWQHDDVCKVLSGEIMGTDAVKGIVLVLPEPEEIYIDPNAFDNMKGLRVLILINVHSTCRDPICLPIELRWFEWPECPPWFPKFPPGRKKLVGLDLHKGNIQVVREQFKGFENLRFINFRECQSVVCMPNLNCTPNLEVLNLNGCKNLEFAHESVANHGKLHDLDLSGCSQLHHLADVLRSKNLRHLNLNGCLKLQKFPDIPEIIEGIDTLNLESTSIEQLPASIKNLVSLEQMNLMYCEKLASLPPSIYDLPELGIMNLRGCSKLIKFPKLEEDSNDPLLKTGFPKLKFLDLTGCNLSEVEFLENQFCFPSLSALWLSKNNITYLPTCGQLHNLVSLDVSYCQQLQEIIDIPGQLRDLRANSCESLSKIPLDICHLDSVELSSCHELVRNGFTTNDLLMLEHCPPTIGCRLLLPGGEMPKWLPPNEEGSISFMASKELYEKFQGLVFCVAFRVEGGKKDVTFELLAKINGMPMKENTRTIQLLDLDHVYIECCNPKHVWEVDPYCLDDCGHFQFSVRACGEQLGGEIVKKLGYLLI